VKAIPPILCCGVRPLASALLLAIIAGVARGDGKVVATYLKTDPAASFAFKTQPQDRFVDAWKNQKGQFTRKSGRLEWQVPETEPGTGRMGREFSTYCAEALVGVVPGKTYQFDVQEPNVPEAFGLPDDPAGWAEADRRARFVRELFGRYYPDSLKDGAAAQSFQIALWEIIHESEFPEGPSPFSLFGGTFRFDTPDRADPPAYVRRAEEYLKALTGDDLPFYKNPELEGKQLVRLKGLPEPADCDGAGGAPQSQFALQYAPDAGNTSPSAGPTGSTPAASVGNGGGNGGGSGSGGGGMSGSPGIGGFPFGSGSSGTAIPAFAPLVSSVPVGGPSETPGQPGSNTNTGGQPSGPQSPDTPGTLLNSVPAPAGLLLGILGVALLGLRRFLPRRKS
jgi:hypothetical protein